MAATVFKSIKGHDTSGFTGRTYDGTYESARLILVMVMGPGYMAKICRVVHASDYRGGKPYLHITGNGRSITVNHGQWILGNDTSFFVTYNPEAEGYRRAE